MKYPLLLSALLSITWSLDICAQAYEHYTWETTPAKAQPGEASQPEVQLYRHIQYEYTYEDINSPTLYFTRHEMVRVNTDEAVASNNRIYISMNRVQELVEVHARTINPDGRVVELNKSDIKEVEDEEAGSGYKIFAIDGAQTGSIIEYYYTSKMAPSYFGREYFQFQRPTKKASFKLIGPSNLQFEFKSYNGFAEVIKNEQIKDKNVYTGVGQDIPSLKPENFSAYNDNRQRIEFKLAYNSVKGNVRLFTWEAAGQNIYAQMHNLEKQELKKVDKILKSIHVEQYNTPFLKAAAIEDYVKTKFYIDENRSSNNYSIDFIYKNRFSSKYGITRLMVALLEKADLPIELVLTNDRGDVKMDGSFESYNYLDEYLIYLPKEDKYIAPYHSHLRLEMAPPEFTANQGLFVRTMKVRDYAYPVSEIRYIAPAKAEDNFDNMDITVDFDQDLTANAIRMDRSFKGYQASYIKAVLPLLEADKREEMMKSLVKFMGQDADIQDLKFEKTQFDFKTYQDPLTLNSTFKTSAFVERAGPALLFKVGELIGPQSELYQEEKRMLPVENEFNRSYVRTIRVTLPDSYEVQNLKDIVIKAEAKNEGKTVYYFKSEYSLEGRVLLINVTEAYHEIYYPLAKFEDFRKVVNAAADFNKVVLVMKKSKRI